MKQRSFADAEYAAKPRQTRQDRFLSKIDAATPWPALLAVIDPFYPKAGNGRPPLGMLCTTQLIGDNTIQAGAC